MKAALKKSLKMVEVEIPVDLVYLSWTSVLDFVLKPRPKAPAKPGFTLPKGKCLHSEVVSNTASGTIDRVWCATKVARGWFCHSHEWKFLARRPAVQPTPQVKDFAAEIVENILRTEERALRAVARESYGLIKRIQFVKGLRMKTSPEDVQVPEPTPQTEETQP